MENNKRCTAVLDMFCALDKNEHLPLRVTLHLLFCRTCRTQVRMMTLAEKAAAAPFAAAPDSAAPIMEKIQSAEYVAAHKTVPVVSLKNWYAGGALMMMCLFIFSVFSRDLSGNFIIIGFYLVFAVAVFVYCILFISSNIDFFIKKIDRLFPPPAHAE